jgi:hypothetical protein
MGHLAEIHRALIARVGATARERLAGDLGYGLFMLDDQPCDRLPVVHVGPSPLNQGRSRFIFSSSGAYYQPQVNIGPGLRP